MALFGAIPQEHEERSEEVKVEQGVVQVAAGAAGDNVTIPPVDLIRWKTARWEQGMGKDAADRDMDGVGPSRLHHLTDLNRFLQRVALLLPRKEGVIEV